MSRVALVPGVPALLPAYASLDDPVAELRAACLDAVAWLVEGGPVTVVADDQGRRVADHLVSEVGGTTRAWGAPDDLRASGATVLVVGNGSACRSERAPGHLDERAPAFDAALGRHLRDAASESLAALDRHLARELRAGVDPIIEMAAIPDLSLVGVDYDDDPYGVQYWVMRWAGRLT